MCYERCVFRTRTFCTYISELMGCAYYININGILMFGNSSKSDIFTVSVAVFINIPLSTVSHFWNHEFTEHNYMPCQGGTLGWQCTLIVRLPTGKSGFSCANNTANISHIYLSLQIEMFPLIFGIYILIQISRSCIA